MKEPRQPYWLTRSLREGKLSNFVEFWTVWPERYAYLDGDSEWAAPAEFVDIHDAATYIGSCHVEEAMKLCGTIPETAIECIRVGQEAD